MVVLDYKTPHTKEKKNEHMRTRAVTKPIRTRFWGSQIVGGKTEIDKHTEAAAVVTNILSPEARGARGRLVMRASTCLCERPRTSNSNHPHWWKRREELEKQTDPWATNHASPDSSHGVIKK